MSIAASSAPTSPTCCNASCAWRGRTARARRSSPTSATAQNAREFAELLAAEPFLEGHRLGEPREARRIFLVRAEASPYTLALDILTTLVEAGRTIAFTKARRITELLYGWLQHKDRLGAYRRAGCACYRAGFCRRSAARSSPGYLSGELDAVISTSAWSSASTSADSTPAC